MLTATERYWGYDDFIKLQVTEDVCVDSATCPNLEVYSFLKDEESEREWKSLNFRNEITIEYDASSGTYYVAEDAEKITFVNSPFDELDEKLPDGDKIDRSLVAMRQNTSISFAQRLANRLRELYESVLEDPHESPISLDSLIYFINFLSETPGIKYPDVSLTPTNEIRAQWRTASNRHFAVSFSSIGDARFVIFKPNPEDPDRIDRLSGITSVGSLIRTTQHHRVLEWASQW